MHMTMRPPVLASMLKGWIRETRSFQTDTGAPVSCVAGVEMDQRVISVSGLKKYNHEYFIYCVQSGLWDDEGYKTGRECFERTLPIFCPAAWRRRTP